MRRTELHSLYSYLSHINQVFAAPAFVIEDHVEGLVLVVIQVKRGRLMVSTGWGRVGQHDEIVVSPFASFLHGLAVCTMCFLPFFSVSHRLREISTSN